MADNGHTKTYKNDDAGERVIKRGPQGETAYINQFYTMRNREVGTKHVFAGGTRLVSKLVKAPNVVDLDGDGLPDDLPNGCSEPWGWTNGNGGQGNGQGPCNNNGNGGQNGNGGNNSTGPEVFEKDQYYYHPDHLGSSSYVTDLDGEIFQHLEYFPFGETWVEEHSNTQRTPYLFTAKELDEETGLYYFGARYYDPRTSVWQSPDPILAEYMPMLNSGADTLPNRGVFEPKNMSVYMYAFGNPLIFLDPDGNACASADGETTCVPENSDFPTITFPTPEGWDDFEADDLDFHSYLQDEEAGTGDAGYRERLEEGLIASPTPGEGSATEEGTVIDVLMPMPTGRDDVTSYIGTMGEGENETRFIFNVTEQNHTLGSGFVIRLVSGDEESGYTIRSYGEGDAIKQLFPGEGVAARATWRGNSREIIRGAQNPQ